MDFTYRFTGETKIVDGVKVKRIESPAGELGGWIEKEENLAQNNECFVEEEAVVMGNAIVKEQGTVTGNAIVKGRSIIEGEATIEGNAYVDIVGSIGGNFIVTDNAKITGTSVLTGGGLVANNVEIYNSRLTDASITDNAKIFNSTINKAKVLGNSQVLNGASVSMGAKIWDATVNNTIINEKVILSHGENIEDVGDYVYINIGWGQEITLSKKGINWGTFHWKFGDWDSPAYKAYVSGAIAGKLVKGEPLNRRKLLRRFLDPSDYELFPQVLVDEKAKLVFNYLFKYTTTDLLSLDERDEIVDSLGYNSEDYDMLDQNRRNAFADLCLSEKSATEIRDAVLLTINKRDVSEQ